jgi:hypothetical protein
MRQQEAQVRAKAYTYENSKAKRLGTATKAEWEAKQSKLTD